MIAVIVFILSGASLAVTAFMVWIALRLSLPQWAAIPILLGVVSAYTATVYGIGAGLF